jgi:hypothetical protein
MTQQTCDLVALRKTGRAGTRQPERTPSPSGEPADPSGTVEAMLREMAYVYHLTRMLKREILEQAVASD